MSPRRLKAELTDAKQSIISFGMYVADLEKALKKRGYMANRIQAMRRKHNLDGTMEMSNGDVVTFDIQYDTEVIEKLIERVKISREYIKTLI